MEGEMQGSGWEEEICLFVCGQVRQRSNQLSCPAMLARVGPSPAQWLKANHLSRRVVRDDAAASRLGDREGTLRDKEAVAYTSCPSTMYSCQDGSEAEENQDVKEPALSGRGGGI